MRTFDRPRMPIWPNKYKAQHGRVRHMPVPLKQLRESAGLRDDAGPQRVLDLLRSTPDEAWRPVEISEELGIDQRTLSRTLTRLARKGLIDSEKGHWYALDDREVAKRVAMLTTARLATERLGSENPKAWIDTPQD